MLIFKRARVIAKFALFSHLRTANFIMLRGSFSNEFVEDAPLVWLVMYMLFLKFKYHILLPVPQMTSFIKHAIKKNLSGLTDKRYC